MSVDDCREPFYGPHPLKYDLSSIGYPGYWQSIDDAGQISTWTHHGAVEGRRLSSNPLGQVGLSKDGHRYKRLEYQLWCLRVLGPPPEDGLYYTVDHLDRNGKNNSPYNFRWATVEQQNSNRNPYKRTIKWELLNDDEQLLERRQFFNLYFIETGFQVKQRKDGSWVKSCDRKLAKGYYVCRVSRNKGYKGYYINRVIAHIFGDKDGLFLLNIDDRSIVIEHMDSDKTNNRRDNLRVSNQSNNIQTWHASGNSNKRKVYAISKDDKDADMLEFDSAADAARKIQKVSGSCITKVCKEKHNTAGGYYWSYEPFN